MCKTIKSAAAMLICCSFLFGCASAVKQVGEKFTNPVMKIDLPERFFAIEKTVPSDIKMVSAAILNRLRHRGETAFVRFDPAAGTKIGKESFNYEGFDVVLVDITGFDAEKVEKNKVQGVLEGVFHFEDFVGRRASAYFAASYLKTPDGIVIGKAGVTTIVPLFPRVEAYFVPLEAFKNIPVKGAGYWDMYAFALNNSLDMKPTKKELQAYRAYQDLSAWKKLTDAGKTEKKKIAVMIFCLDRLSDVSRFEVNVTENGVDSAVKPRFINQDGWPVAVVAGEFVPDSWGATFDISAYYYPEGKRNRLLVGKFSNQKDYNPQRQQSSQATAVTQEAPPVVHEPAEPVTEQGKIQETKPSQESRFSFPQKVEGPIASGSVFLNPSVKPDARIIQKRLADLGYYKSAVDGLFGQGSRQSVLRYKKEKGLPGNTTWDIQTQKALFEGSGL